MTSGLLGMDRMAESSLATSFYAPSVSGGTLPGSPDLRQLISAKSGTWLEFRKTLRPNYARAWFELCFCIAMMITGYSLHLYLARSLGDVFGFKAGIFVAIWIGFWLNSVLTFGHEAAHYNLASDKNHNDFFSDWTIWLFFPQSTKAYRRSHWQHHLHLGDHEDTEISYHNCLSPWFLAKALTGVHLATLFVRYFFRKRAPAVSNNASAGGQSAGIVPLLRPMVVHSVFVGVAVAFHCYSTAAVWLSAVIFVFPFLASVRQILEHRAASASCATDFAHELHGPVNRLFGKDPFSIFFGAAGFNRHLLHHWDPTVSYTCFDQMQRFLAETEFRSALESSKSSYLATFTTLLKSAVRNDG